MGFFDKLSESLSETGQGIKKMADDTSAKSQMNSELKKKEKELEALVYQVGLVMVSNEPEICSQKCGDLYAQIVNAREAAKDIRNRLMLLDAEIVCPGCGKTIKGVTEFCANCGTKLPEPNMDMNANYDLPTRKAVVNEQTAGTCSNCGAPLKPGAAFCTNCGTPVK